MSLRIRTGDFAAFYAAGLAAYGPDMPFVAVPKSDLKRLLFCRDRDIAFFTAHGDTAPLGRIMVHAPWRGGVGHAAACFAHFDCVDDPGAAQALLEIAAGWARARGLVRIIGNVTLTDLPQLGVMTDGFAHPPVSGTQWSAPHIAQLLAENGYAPAGDMATFCIDPRVALPPDNAPAGPSVLDDPDYSIAPQSTAQRLQRLTEAEVILTEAIGQVAPFVGPFRLKGQRRTDPALCMILHHRGHPVGCCLGLPDLRPGQTLLDRWTGLRLIRPRSVVLLSGVLPPFQGLGITPLLLRRAMLALRAGGYDSVSTHCTADLDGLDTAQSGVSLRHRLQLFGKAVQAVNSA